MNKLCRTTTDAVSTDHLFIFFSLFPSPQHTQFLEELKKQYLEKKEHYRSIAALSEMQNELKELSHQIAWAMVILFVSGYFNADGNSCDACSRPSVVLILVLPILGERC